MLVLLMCLTDKIYLLHVNIIQPKSEWAGTRRSNVNTYFDVRKLFYMESEKTWLRDFIWFFQPLDYLGRRISLSSDMCEWIYVGQIDLEKVNRVVNIFCAYFVNMDDASIYVRWLWYLRPRVTREDDVIQQLNNNM